MREGAGNVLRILQLSKSADKKQQSEVSQRPSGQLLSGLLPSSGLPPSGLPSLTHCAPVAAFSFASFCFSGSE